MARNSDVKTGTKNFVPKGIYKEVTPEENGAWSTWKANLPLPELGGDETIPIFAVSHRRGESIHCFVASCGTTLDGIAHMCYFEDDEERTQVETDDFEIARKGKRRRVRAPPER